LLNSVVFNRILDVVHSANPNAFVTGEVFFLPYFNYNYGSATMPVDIEVLVASHELTETEKKLQQTDQTLRFRVLDLKGLDVRTYLQKNASLIAFAGAVRMNNDLPEMVYAFDETEIHLKQGVLQWNTFTDKDTALIEATRWHDMFTGLKSSLEDAKLNELELDWEKIEKNMKIEERGGKIADINLSEKGEAIKQEMMQWHLQASKDANTIPIPPRAKLPTGDPWVASDEEFREWIIDQFLTKYPVTPKDPYVQLIIDMQRESDQKPTHLGWKVYQHAIFAALCLDTKGFTFVDRKIARLAIMWHDLGKCSNIWTPGAHGSVGGKLWKRYKPNWITESEEKRISLLIKAHDYLGLMDRAIKDDHFRGGVSPQQIISFIEDDLKEDLYYGLQLISRIYLADISSVSTLRWLISLTDLLNKMVIMEYESTKLPIAL
jgi:hypothetical protein